MLRMRLFPDWTSTQTHFRTFHFRNLPIWERTYCWVVIIIGLCGGASATYTAVKNIVSTDFAMPCYLQVSTLLNFFVRKGSYTLAMFFGENAGYTGDRLCTCLGPLG